jgi:hypothetical protein
MAKRVTKRKSKTAKEKPSVIIGGQNASVAGGVNAKLKHLLTGARNEYSLVIQGTAQDARDWYADAKAKARLKHWAHMFMVAPQLNVTRHQFMTEVLPLVARLFNFSPAEAIIFEHALKRKHEAGSGIHWHLIVKHIDYAGRARSWAWDRVVNERLSRTLEVKFGERILKGRHTKAVVQALRADGEHATADAIEAAHPIDAEPAARTPAPAIEQMAKGQGVDLREIGKTVRQAYDAADNIEEFREMLANSGLSLAVSYRVENRPAWVIHNQAGFLRSLGGALAGTTLKSIKQKIGDPPNAGHDENDAGGSGQVGNGHAGFDSDTPDVAAESHDGFLRVGDQFGPRDQGSIAKVFSAAALSDPVKATMLRDRFLSALRGSREVAEIFLAEVVRRAREFIKYIAPKMKLKPNPVVQGLREELANARTAQDAAHVSWARADVDVLEITLAPDPGTNRLDHEKRIALLKLERDRRAIALKNAKQAVVDRIASNQAFEDHYDTKNADYQKTEVALQVIAAKRSLDVAARVEALVKEHPEVLWMGPAALTRYGLIEASKAAPGAKFLVNADSGPYRPDEDDDPDTVVTVQPK